MYGLTLPYFARSLTNPAPSKSTYQNGRYKISKDTIENLSDSNQTPIIILCIGSSGSYRMRIYTLNEDWSKAVHASDNYEDSTKDILVCLGSCCFPACTVGRLVGLQRGEAFNIIACCCTPIGAYRARRTIQAMHVDKESEDGSTIAATCCLPCAVAQDFREWKRMGNSTSPPAVPPSKVEPPSK